MSIVKVKLLLVTLMSFSVGTVGCATAQQYNTASLETKRVTFKDDQAATTSATENQTATSPSDRFVQASYHQPVQPASNTSTLAPLTTLGLGDDLRNMVGQASGVVLIDFYADWCGPCRTQGGILHEMESTASQNNASIIKINVDQHRQLASAFNVTSMPTLILIKNGQIIERQTGVANHQKVASLLSR